MQWTGYDTRQLNNMITMDSYYNNNILVILSALRFVSAIILSSMMKWYRAWNWLRYFPLSKVDIHVKSISFIQTALLSSNLFVHNGKVP